MVNAFLNPYIGTSKAMSILRKQGYGKITRTTIIHWVKKYNLGIKVGGIWKIDEKKFEKFLKEGTQNREK